MFRRLQEDARTLRALLAIGIAAALAAVLFVQERAQATAKERAVFAVSAISWKVSELIFEAQRLATGLEDFADGRITQSDVNLRFDLMWSRLTVLENSEVADDPQFAAILSTFGAFLSGEEAVIYDAPVIPPDTVRRLVADIDELTRLARVSWVDLFAARQVDRRAIELTELQRADAGYRLLVIVLILMLMIYVVGEVWFAGRGQRRERALREAAARANEAKTRFLATVSHEIRTPLNGILGMAAELAETDLTADQARCLSVLEQSGGVLLGTINDVLDLSRIEAGQMHVEFRPYALREMLDAACALYSARARERGLTLGLTVDAGLPAMIEGDGRRLRQVLHNLVANAVKFTETGSVSVLAEAREGRLRIRVTDTGPGIPPEARQRVFEPFGQADTSATRQHGGTGLGLTISRQLCVAMGGDLTLADSDRGAAFVIDLPLVAAPEPALVHAAPVSPPPDLSGQDLLVVDDNATNRMILERFLAPSGARVHMADCGEAAVQAAQATRFCMILMDIQMPGMDGVAATLEIRRQAQEAGRPRTTIVAVTANVLSHQVQEYRDAGMDDVLPKPVSKKALLALLGRCALPRAA